jgi:hypothetical protein
MKLINRYHLWASLECQHFSKAEAVLKFSAEEDGMWVQWQDYALLKAEVERLTERLNRHLEINDELDARCTRLRKAGDAMQKRLYVLENPTHPEVYLKLLSAWNAAKEGKPSV